MSARPSFLKPREWKVICENADNGDKDAIDFKKSVEQLMAKAKDYAKQESEREKKNRNHEVFIVGGAIISEAAKNPSFMDIITKVIDRNVKRKSDIKFLANRGWGITYEEDDSTSDNSTPGSAI
ncbi:MAG: hypothetical protein VXY23_07855 [Pseudomonadota bacterium]|nr:hypothetical protein [Pseudomonadota bacterium]